MTFKKDRIFREKQILFLSSNVWAFDFVAIGIIYTGLEKMIATPSRAKMVIVREMPIPYSDSTSKSTLKKFIFYSQNMMVWASVTVLSESERLVI